MTMSNVAAPAGSANPQHLRDMPRPRPLAIWEGVHAVLRGHRNLFLGTSQDRDCRRESRD